VEAGAESSNRVTGGLIPSAAGTEACRFGGTDDTPVNAARPSGYL